MLQHVTLYTLVGFSAMSFVLLAARQGFADETGKPVDAIAIRYKTVTIEGQEIYS